MKIHDDKMIVLTGGAGFIGSAILRVLNENNLHNIVVVDALNEGVKWHNLVNKRFTEYLHKDQFFQWLAQPSRSSEIEAVIHMGACSSTVETRVDYLMENNYRYTVKLAEYCLKHEIKFIYASSAATYGNGDQGFVDDVNNLESLRPLNPYGFSKHLFDLWAKNQGVLNQIVGLKFFNVFGPNESHKGRMASVIYNLLPQIQKEGVIRLFKSNDPVHFADGDQKRDFIYVKDVAAIVYRLLKEEVYGLYNLGSGEASSWNQVATSMFAALKKEANIQYRSMPADLEKSYQNYTKADMKKLRNQLEGFQLTPLHEAVVDYIQNYIVLERVY